MGWGSERSRQWWTELFPLWAVWRGCHCLRPYSYIDSFQISALYLATMWPFLALETSLWLSVPARLCEKDVDNILLLFYFLDFWQSMCDNSCKTLVNCLAQISSSIHATYSCYHYDQLLLLVNRDNNTYLPLAERIKYTGNKGPSTVPKHYRLSINGKLCH